MTWIVNVYADIPLAVPAQPLIERSPMFSAWQSVGGTQRRLTPTVPDDAADDADTACDVAKAEVTKCLTPLLQGVSECNATQM